MDILSYLSELVQTRKAIGISGLGTISKKKSPGRYDAQTHSFVPPSYVLDFTEEVKEDIILPEFISRKRNVSTETAIYFINEFSAGIHQQLNEQNEADLGVLGKLKKQDNQLVYEPARGLEFGFDFYGLPSIKAEPPYIASVTKDISEEEEALATGETIEESVTSPEEIPGDPAETTIVTSEETTGKSEEIEGIKIAEEIHSVEETTEEPNSAEESETAEGIKSTATEETAVPVSLITPAEEPTLEDVIADNQVSEENPGDTTTDQTVAEIADDRKKDTDKLYADIEALNTYRAKSPVNPIPVNVQEEVIWNLKQPSSPEVNAAPQYYTLPDVPPDPEVEKTTSTVVKVLTAIALLLVLVTAMYLMMPDLFRGRESKDSQKKDPTVKVADTINQTTLATDSTLVQDTSKTDSSALKNTVVPPGTDLKNTKETALAPATAINGADSVVTYEIIGGAVLNQKEVEYFIYQMKKSGITAKALPKEPGKKRLKMSLATFKDKAEAELELKRLDKKLKIEGIYIYRNKQQ